MANYLINRALNTDQDLYVHGRFMILLVSTSNVYDPCYQADKISFLLAVDIE